MINKNDVSHIALLARIRLREDELEHLTGNLEQILTYVEKLGELNVDDIKPTSHVLPIKNVFREDNVEPSLAQADALSIAVDQHSGSFRVPQVIE